METGYTNVLRRALGGQPPRHDPEPGERYTQHVGNDAGERYAVEVIGRESARRDGGYKSGGEARANRS